MDLQLNEIKHPLIAAQSDFDNLIAIDEQKQALIGTLQFFFDNKRLERWKKKHHSAELALLNKVVSGTPLIILEGDVGCGKTALAHSVGTPLAKLLDKRLYCFETPSNLRGSGRVGEISARITEAFNNVKIKLKGDDVGLFIIDEADDLATDREQNQAHHEDRAGLNVLIKQVDAVARDRHNMAVILITNRLKVLDPAIVRRASLIIPFGRPGKEGIKKVFEGLLDGVDTTEKQLNQLVSAAMGKKHLYCFSDLFQKVGRQALIRAIAEDRPFNYVILLEMMAAVEPSPLIK